MKPVKFDLFNFADAPSLPEGAQNIIYTIYSDYVNRSWNLNKRFSYRLFKECLISFLTENKVRKLYLLLASEKQIKNQTKPRSISSRLKLVLAAILLGENAYRYKRCNEIVRKVSMNYSHVHLVEAGDYVLSPDEQIDPRHFERIVIKRICETLI